MSQINEATADTGPRRSTSSSATRATPTTRRTRPRSRACSSEDVSRHHRRRVVGRVAAVHRPGHRCRRHPVLAGQHVRRASRRRTTTACYLRTAPSDVLQGEVLGNLIAEDGHQNARHDRAERLVRHRPARKYVTEALRGRRRRGRRSAQSYNTGDTSFDAQIAARSSPPTPTRSC